MFSVCRFLLHNTRTSVGRVFNPSSCKILSPQAINATARCLHTSAPTNTRIVCSSSHHPDIPIPTNKSYVEFILEHCEQHGDKHAIADPLTGKSFTYKDVTDLTKKCGSAFKRMGMKHKDVVALYMPNLPEYPMVFYGIQAAGGIATTVNPSYTVDELAYQLRDSGAQYLVTTSEFLGKAREAESKVKLPSDNVLDIDTLWNLVVSDDVPYIAKLHTTTSPSDDVTCLVYSSGTTGLPKGVMMTHTNLIAHTLILGNNKYMPLGADVPPASVMGLLPFFHVFGLIIVLGMHFFIGSKVFCMQRFDHELFLKTIEEHKITDLPTVPPIGLFLTKHPLVEKFDLSSINIITFGAAPICEEVQKQLSERLPSIRVIRQAYGLTEATAACTFNPINPLLVKSASVGHLLPNLEAVVRDVKTGEALGPGEPGEICIRGPTICKGYLNKPEQTVRTIDKYGWLQTGDIGYYDADEYFYIVDRLKELIKYKGYQVAPAELEAVLLTNRYITDAAVIGIPDEEAGELPRAFVVSRGGITAEKVQQYVADKVAPYKKLRGGVVFVDSIPKSVSGKILRKHLRDEYSK